MEWDTSGVTGFSSCLFFSYRISITSRVGVPQWSPGMPRQDSIIHGLPLRQVRSDFPFLRLSFASFQAMSVFSLPVTLQFFLSKLINGERSCLGYSQYFSGKNLRTREMQLGHMYKSLVD